MPERIYITGYSQIGEGHISVNGVPLLQDDGETGFLVQAYRQLEINYPKFYKMDHLARLGWLAAELLLREQGLPARYSAAEIGIVFENASASLDADLRYFDTVKDMASPALFVYTLPNIVIGEICIRHKFKGENAFFIFETFDADFLHKYVSGLINNNILQGAICGWVEVMPAAHKAVLFLVEKENRMAPVSQPTCAFTKENLDHIYHSTNG